MASNFDIFINLSAKTDEGQAVIEQLRQLGAGATKVSSALEDVSDAKADADKPMTGPVSVPEVNKQAVAVDRLRERCRQLAAERGRLYNRPIVDAPRDVAAIRQVQSAADGLSSRLKVLAGTAAIVGLVKAGVAYNETLEGANRRLTMLLGSEAAATHHLRELQGLAKSSDQYFDGIERASEILLNLRAGALASGDGLRLVLDIASATQRPLDQVAMSLGRLYQSAEAGVMLGDALGPLRDAGIVSGQAAAKIQQMITAGAGLQATWAVVNAELERFRGSSEKASQDGSGAFVRLANTWRQAVGELSEEVFAALKDGVNDIADAIERMPKDKLRDLGVLAGNLVSVLSTLTTTAIQNSDALVFLAEVAIAGKLASAVATIGPRIAAIGTAALGSTGGVAALSGGMAALATSTAGVALVLGFTIDRLVKLSVGIQDARAAWKKVDDDQVANAKEFQAKILQDGVASEEQRVAYLKLAKIRAADESMSDDARDYWARIAQELDAANAATLRFRREQKLLREEREAAEKAAAADKEAKGAAMLDERTKATERLVAAEKERQQIEQAAFQALPARQRLAALEQAEASMAEGPGVAMDKALTDEGRRAVWQEWSNRLAQTRQQIAAIKGEIAREDEATTSNQTRVRNEYEVAKLRLAGREEEAAAMEDRLALEERILELKRQGFGEEAAAIAKTLAAAAKLGSETVGGIRDYSFADDLSRKGFFRGGQISAQTTDIPQRQLKTLETIANNTDPTRNKGSTAILAP